MVILSAPCYDYYKVHVHVYVYVAPTIKSTGNYFKPTPPDIEITKVLSDISCYDNTML